MGEHVPAAEELVRGAVPGLPGAKEDKIPEMTPHLCLHGKEHVGSIEQDTFFLSDLQFSCLQNGAILVRLMCLSMRVKSKQALVHQVP